MQNHIWLVQAIGKEFLRDAMAIIILKTSCVDTRYMIWHSSSCLPTPAKARWNENSFWGCLEPPFSRRIAHEIYMTSLFCPTIMVNWSFSNAGRPWTNGRVNCYCHPNPLLFLIWKRRNYPKSRLTYLRNIELRNPSPDNHPTANCSLACIGQIYQTPTVSNLDDRPQFLREKLKGVSMKVSTGWSKRYLRVNVS